MRLVLITIRYQFKKYAGMYYLTKSLVFLMLDSELRCPRREGEDLKILLTLSGIIVRRNGSLLS